MAVCLFTCLFIAFFELNQMHANRKKSLYTKYNGMHRFSRERNEMTIKTTNFSDEWEMSSNLLNQSLQWPFAERLSSGEIGKQMNFNLI